MAERKSLKEGLLQLNPGVDPEQGEEFIFHGKPKPASTATEIKPLPAPSESIDSDQRNSLWMLARTLKQEIAADDADPEVVKAAGLEDQS